MRVVIGLGSNLSDRKKNLKFAISQLKFLSNIKESKIYETEALLLEGSPPEWNIPYYNMAVSGDTELSLKEIFIQVKELEKKMGRDLDAPRWSPRIIDLDILIADESYEDEDLVVPHKELYNRDFALIPAAEIAPDLVDMKALLAENFSQKFAA